MPESGQDSSESTTGRSLDNQEVARVFADIATLLKLRGDSVFKIRAYTRAAEVFEHLPGQVALLARDEDQLKEIPGIGDAILFLGYLFTQGPPPLCDDAADVNDSGSLNLADVIHLLQYLFVPGSAPPPPPFPDCGADPTADGLGCDSPPCP